MENNLFSTDKVISQVETNLKCLPLRKMLPEGFLKEIDSNFKQFCRGIRDNLRKDNYEIIGVTGYPGTGKSQLVSIMGCLIDENYSFDKNINFIPTSTEIEKDYLKLPMYSFLHIDEASRSIHKHKWYEKTQQKLSTLYDTEREGHYLCSVLIMPRFQNFTENFRNFFIKYWINVICRGIAIVYKRDEDKDTKDPWNVDFNMKLKQKYWKGKRIFERSVSDIIRMEQKTKNYWFYFKIPEIPKEIWEVYQKLKSESRITMRESETNLETASYKDRVNMAKMDRWKKIVELRNENKTYEQIAVTLNVSSQTIRKSMREIEAYQSLKGSVDGSILRYTNTNNNIYNQVNKDDLNEIRTKVDNI